MADHIRKEPRLVASHEFDKLTSRLEQRTSLEYHPEDSIRRLRQRVELELLAHAGLRSVELVNLKPEDIEWASEDNDGITSLHLCVTKGNKYRQVPLAEESAEWLRVWCEVSDNWRNANAATADYLFHQCDKAVFSKHLGKPMSTRNLRLNIARGVEHALGEHALGRVSPHTFRHTYISELMENDVPLPKVKALVGHTSDRTTLGYTHFSAKALHKAVTSAL